ncbi:tRNA lysidine(34) synthetase TilS [Mesorhizobium sp. RMAD-H1]|uniref:tRNA lysidine(34) synthetase TilS n=1 Tax=Mesorhizobium sp. RMAD-H1 TaxID=2587065 RepID=UPI00160A84C1|nr:tRNA lysidine(34) synthetase TilS [Mesorhizobium sp. RMAD-H1]MBB2973538.1 tRNA(Ile)-lysidine synthase [Mesorhizobium sp. RMAD-H1]
MSVPETAAKPVSRRGSSTADPARVFASIDFGRERAVIAAVSGGSDSLALLFLLKDHLSRIGKAPALIAVTVDHGLRPESADEAAAVAQLCRRHGIVHRILRWEGRKPETGIPAAAREARYRLLVEAARQAGAGLIFTGHTQDDQIETFLMRRARGDGRGLAGMANLTLLDGAVWLLRPLLETRRDDLRAFLSERRIAWFDDPTNENMAFERPRIRSRAGGAETGAILEEIAARAAERRARGMAAAGFLSAGGVHVEPGDAIAIDAGRLADAGQDVAGLALGVLVALVGGRSFLPGEAERERLFVHLAQEDSGPARLSLCGCIVQRGARRHRIWREARGLPDVTLAPGACAVWDGRYRIANSISGQASIRITAPTAAECNAFCEQKGLERRDFHRAAVLTGPAVHAGGGIIDIPALTGGRFLPAGLAVTRYVALYDKVLPGHDLALANAAARLIGRDLYPEPPILLNML